MMTSTHQKFGATLLLAGMLLTGIYSCNDTASEAKKADSTTIPAVDTTVRPGDTMIKLPDSTTKKLAPSDAVQPSDTGRDIKVPKPTR